MLYEPRAVQAKLFCVPMIGLTASSWKKKDVNAKDEVMRLVAGLKKSGAAVVLASTEPELVLAHADRILVFARGRIAHEFVGEEVRKADLLRWA